jgi:hypothetical protein
MHRILKVAVSAVGIAIVIYVVSVAAFVWQLRVVTDVSRYDDLIRRWEPSLVEHFPSRIPINATKQSLSFFPGLWQGGAHFQLRTELPPADVADEEARLSKIATHVCQRGECTYPDSSDDVMRNVPLPPFHTGDKNPSAGFPADYVLYYLIAQPGESAPWNHGQTTGVAVSRQSSELVYWAENW